MTKDEEIEHLTDLNARIIDRNGLLNRELKKTQAFVENQKIDILRLFNQLEEAKEKILDLESDNKQHVQMFDQMLKRNVTLEDVNSQLTSLIYNVIGMLATQNAEDVRANLVSILNRRDYESF